MLGFRARCSTCPQVAHSGGADLCTNSEMSFGLILAIAKYNGGVNLGKSRNSLYFRLVKNEQMLPEVTEPQWTFQHESMKHLCWVTRNGFKKVCLNVKAIINKLRDSEDSILKLIVMSKAWSTTNLLISPGHLVISRSITSLSSSS